MIRLLLLFALTTSLFASTDIFRSWKYKTTSTTMTATWTTVVFDAEDLSEHSGITESAGTFTANRDINLIVLCYMDLDAANYSGSETSEIRLYVNGTTEVIVISVTPANSTGRVLTLLGSTRVSLNNTDTFVVQVRSDNGVTAGAGKDIQYCDFVERIR